MKRRGDWLGCLDQWNQSMNRKEELLGPCRPGGWVEKGG